MAVFVSRNESSDRLLGAVDGFSFKQEYRVDGFSMEENSQTVSRLHALLSEEGISS